MNLKNDSKLNFWVFFNILIPLIASQCCIQFSNSKCILCPEGMRLFRNNCLFNIPACVQYNQTTGFDCTKCAQGFNLVSQGANFQCIQNQTQNKQNQIQNNTENIFRQIPKNSIQIAAIVGFIRPVLSQYYPELLIQKAFKRTANLTTNQYIYRLIFLTDKGLLELDVSISTDATGSLNFSTFQALNNKQFAIQKASGNSGPILILNLKADEKYNEIKQFMAKNYPDYLNIQPLMVLKQKAITPIFPQSIDNSSRINQSVISYNYRIFLIDQKTSLKQVNINFADKRNNLTSEKATIIDQNSNGKSISQNNQKLQYSTIEIPPQKLAQVTQFAKGYQYFLNKYRQKLSKSQVLSLTIRQPINSPQVSPIYNIVIIDENFSTQFILEYQLQTPTQRIKQLKFEEIQLSLLPVQVATQKAQIAKQSNKTIQQSNTISIGSQGNVSQPKNSGNPSSLPTENESFRFTQIPLSQVNKNNFALQLIKFYNQQRNRPINDVGRLISFETYQINVVNVDLDFIRITQFSDQKASIQQAIYNVQANSDLKFTMTLIIQRKIDFNRTQSGRPVIDQRNKARNAFEDTLAIQRFFKHLQTRNQAKNSNEAQISNNQQPSDRNSGNKAQQNQQVQSRGNTSSPIDVKIVETSKTSVQRQQGVFNAQQLKDNPSFGQVDGFLRQSYRSALNGASLLGAKIAIKQDQNLIELQVVYSVSNQTYLIFNSSVTFQGIIQVQQVRQTKTLQFLDINVPAQNSSNSTINPSVSRPPSTINRSQINQNNNSTTKVSVEVGTEVTRNNQGVFIPTSSQIIPAGQASRIRDFQFGLSQFAKLRSQIARNLQPIQFKRIIQISSDRTKRRIIYEVLFKAPNQSITYESQFLASVIKGTFELLSFKSLQNSRKSQSLIVNKVQSSRQNSQPVSSFRIPQTNSETAQVSQMTRIMLMDPIQYNSDHGTIESLKKIKSEFRYLESGFAVDRIYMIPNQIESRYLIVFSKHSSKSQVFFATKVLVLSRKCQVVQISKQQFEQILLGTKIINAKAKNA